MIKVFEDFNFSRVGQLQSLLESHGIRTFLKNEFGSSVVGELPFVEVIPQLFVLEQKDVEKAKELLAHESQEAQPAAEWTCSACGAEVDGNFSRCWNCGKDSESST
jgi:hypothetical protein